MRIQFLLHLTSGFPLLGKPSNVRSHLIENFVLFIFLVISDIEHIFMYLLNICIYSLRKHFSGLLDHYFYQIHFFIEL